MDGNAAIGEGRYDLGRSRSDWKGSEAMGEGQCDLARPENRWAGTTAIGEGQCDHGSSESEWTDYTAMREVECDLDKPVSAAMIRELTVEKKYGEGVLVLNGEYYELAEWTDMDEDAHTKGGTLVLMGKVFTVSYDEQAAKRAVNMLEGKNNRIIIDGKNYIVIDMTVDNEDVTVGDEDDHIDSYDQDSVEDTDDQPMKCKGQQSIKSYFRVRKGQTKNKMMTHV